MFEKFKKTSFCDGMPLYMGAQVLVEQKFAPNGDEDKYFFDTCKAVQIAGVWFNEYSMSIKKQLEIMTNSRFESGINSPDPIF